MEYRNAMEKLIKCIPIFMVLILGFVMRCELYHATLGDSVYASYPAIGCDIDEEEFDSFLMYLEKAAEESDTDFFFTKWENISSLEHRFTIFIEDENVKADLEKRNHIKEGSYHSLTNGSSEIEYLSVSALSYDDLMASPYFGVIGSEGAEISLYENLKMEYNVSYPQILQTDEADMTVIIWSLIAILMILINGGVILRKKKEMLIRNVYGEDIVGITIRSMVVDLILYELLYFLAKLFVSAFLSGDYKPELSFLIFESGCVISIALNLLYIKLDIRAVIANVTDNKGVLVFLYALKFIAFALSVFTLTTNFSSLKQLAFSDNTDKINTIYGDGMFLSVSDGEMTVEENIWSTLYGEFYDTVRPVISVKMAEAKNPFILVNEYAAPLLPEYLNVMDMDPASITVFYPKGCQVPDEDIKGLLGLYLENVENVQWVTRMYDTHINVPYISSNQFTSFAEAADPVIFYCPSNVGFNSSIFANSQEVIYDITEDDLDLLDKSLGISEQGDRLIFTRVGEVYEYKMSFLMRLVRFLSSLCILVLLLDFAITVALSSLEYRIFGMVYAVKRIHGYSLVGRNKRQLLGNNAVNIVLILLLSLLGKFTGIYRIDICICAGMVLILVENVVMISHILKLERFSVSKILKGGCL